MEEKSYETNFYALDTETTGFRENEPIQIAVALFQNGVAVKSYNQYFLPKAKI